MAQVNMETLVTKDIEVVTKYRKDGHAVYLFRIADKEIGSGVFNYGRLVVACWGLDGKSRCVFDMTVEDMAADALGNAAKEAVREHLLFNVLFPILPQHTLERLQEGE